ncbi:MAG: hypothetical protein ACRC62_13060 [Microcoleus sp.]
MTDAWEYNEELDTPKSYSAFCLYRDLGPTRSMLQAYKLYKAHQKRPRSVVDGTFKRWSVDGKWDDRSLAWDLAQEKERRSKVSEEVRSAYEKRLEAIRSTAETIALERLQASRIISKIAVREAKKIDSLPSDEFKQKNMAELVAIANLLKLDATSVEAALKIADEALGISDLIEQYSGNKK